jgi:hypothetical protein
VNEAEILVDFLSFYEDFESDKYAIDISQMLDQDK